MTIDELEHGSYYTLRGYENVVLCACHCPDGRWFFEEVGERGRWLVRGNDLMECTFWGDETDEPSGITLADVLPDSPELAAIGAKVEGENTFARSRSERLVEEARVDQVAGDLLAGMDI